MRTKHCYIAFCLLLILGCTGLPVAGPVTSRAERGKVKIGLRAGIQLNETTAYALNDAMKKATRPIHLSLRDISIKKPDFEQIALADYDIVEMDLSNSDIDDDTARLLAKCRKLRTIKLSNCLSVDGSCIEAIAACPLKRLELQGTQVNDNTCKMIRHLSNLEELVLSNTAVTDTGVQEFEQLRLLRTLGLFQCDISDESVCRFASWGNIKVIDVRRNPHVTDKALDCIGNSGSISRVGLDRPDLPSDLIPLMNGLTEKAIDRFRAIHPAVTIYDGVGPMPDL
jgi:hypothetical protein